jgi:hypothetical protein
VEGSDRVRRAALGNDVARATFALTALRADAKFELHFVEGHAGARMTCDFAVGDSAANANDHGGDGALAGWLMKA